MATVQVMTKANAEKALEAFNATKATKPAGMNADTMSTVRDFFMDAANAEKTIKVSLNIDATKANRIQVLGAQFARTIVGDKRLQAVIVPDTLVVPKNEAGEPAGVATADFFVRINPNSDETAG